MNSKLLLINPRVNVVCPDFSFFPPIALGIIAALTPQNWDITVIDENIESLPSDDFDLVGITSNTLSINRAYEIALKYKNRKIPVVMGGCHASIMPDEALEFADSVVIGDAEKIWSAVITDMENCGLKRIYNGNDQNFDFISPDLSYFGHKYFSNAVETSRGCHNNCYFCGVHVPFRRAYRRKPIEMVIEELERSPNPFTFFIDNNFYGNDDAYLYSLFEEIIRRKIKKTWIAAISVRFFQNEELVSLASKSGASIFFVGLESDTKNSLSELNKFNIRSADSIFNYYRSIIEICHKYKILISGNVMIGIESDTKEIIKKRIEFFTHLGLDECSCVILSPLPKTVIYNKLMSEERLLFVDYPKDWEKYHYGKNVIRHDNISTEKLEEFSRITNNSIKSGLGKTLRSFLLTRSFSDFIMYYNYCAHLSKYRNSLFDMMTRLYTSKYKKS